MAARSERNQMIGQLHQLKKQQGLDDDTYREKLALLSGGKRSAADLSDGELRHVLERFHVKPSAAHPHTRMVRALWIACFNLGQFDDGSDKALDAFVKRQTGVDTLSFLTPDDATKVTEGLKDIARRAGATFPPKDKGGLLARQSLLRAQWKLLAKRSIVQDAPWALDEYVSRKTRGANPTIYSLDARQLDQVARSLGETIREEVFRK